DLCCLTPIAFTDSKVAPVGNFVASAGTGELPVAVGVVSVASRHVPKNQDPKAPNPNSGYLGVGLADLGEKDPKGAKIGQVQPKSAAETAKLKVDDIIVEVNKKPVQDAEGLVKMLSKYKPGDSVELKVKRGEEELTLTAKLGKRPPDRADFQNSMG